MRHVTKTLPIVLLVASCGAKNEPSIEGLTTVDSALSTPACGDSNDGGLYFQGLEARFVECKDGSFIKPQISELFGVDGFTCKVRLETSAIPTAILKYTVLNFDSGYRLLSCSVTKDDGTFFQSSTFAQGTFHDDDKCSLSFDLVGSSGGSFVFAMIPDRPVIRYLDSDLPGTVIIAPEAYECEGIASNAHHPLHL